MMHSERTTRTSIILVLFYFCCVSVVKVVLATTSSDMITIGEVILRLETLLPETPGGDDYIVACNIANFVDNCLSNNVEGVSVELKRSDVNMNVAEPQLGHLYYKSGEANTALFTGKGYKESYLFDLLSQLRSAGIKTYAWWPTFNDAVLAKADPTNAQHRRDFGSNTLTTSDQFVSPHSDIVRQHEKSMVMEILDHASMKGWDGIRLDYIRFNHDEDDFSQAARNKYQTLYGSDPMNDVTSIFDQPWKDFRRDEITSFLQEITSECHNYNSSLDVGGYLLPFPAHPGGFDVYQGQGNDFTKYYSFGFRVLPMIYWQDWADSSNFDAWTTEKMYWSVQYTTDTPKVWPTFSVTTTDWCGSVELCHRQHLVDALLIASNSGKSGNVQYEKRTISMFHYGAWGKREWDRLKHSLSEANQIIATGTPAPTQTPDPNDCEYFVPCGYIFHPGKDSPGNDLYTSAWRNIPQITIDCDADPGCEGFNSNGYTKTLILPEGGWENWTSDPCLGLYVKDQSTPAPITQSPISSTPVTPFPTTLAPVTLAPITSSPVTPAPVTTPSPITPAPATPSPVTPAPTPAPTTPCPPVPNGYDFYPGKDSPGCAWGPFNWRDVPAIANDCNHDSGCIAFNSNGWLKWCIQDQSDWDDWTDDPCLGFYIKQ